MNSHTKIFFALLILVASLLLPWFIGSFVSMEYSVILWSDAGRLLLVLATVPSFFLGVMLSVAILDMDF